VVAERETPLRAVLSHEVVLLGDVHPATESNTLHPGSYRLRDVVDLFIYWGRTTPLRANRAPHPLGHE
jgi:hypothetical protein